MTGMQLFGMLMLSVVWMLMAVANNRHRDEHGVNAPGRKAMARIRRNGRRKGIGTEQAYGEWLANKQARAGVVPTPEPMPRLASSITVHAAISGPEASPAVSSAPAREPATLREWRRSSGMTMREIAQAVGLPEHVVAQIENGTRTADSNTVDRLIAAMRAAKEALPAALQFEDVIAPPVTVIYEQTGPVSSGGYVQGHFRKDGTWVKPHYRKPKGYG